MSVVTSAIPAEIGRAAPPVRVALFNSGDPRGTKVGGIETYIRDYIEWHPDDFDLLFVGADESETLPLGEVSEVEFRGRRFKFLPLFRLDSHRNAYGEGITRSDTWRFASELVKNWGLLRRVLRDGGYTAELRRVEYAPLIRSMGVPFVQMVHVRGGSHQQMSSSLGKHWYIRDATEFIAAALARKYYSVNSEMTEMYKRKYRPFAHKFDTLTTWANPMIFRPTPYLFEDGLTHIAYAGRMDRFKRPDLMFRTIAAAHALSDRIRFHYVGDGDPEEFLEFAAIRAITTLHGVKTGLEIAELFACVHIGILTSDFEGMPRVVMEMLTAGRPVVALHLPQLEAVVKDGQSGYLVPRSDDHVEVQGRRLVETFDLMRSGAITPARAAAAVADFSPRALLSKIWNDHRRLQGRAA